MELAEYYSRRRRRRDETSHQIPEISEGLILEQILSTLPVKSLLRFKCISKQWCSLISNKNFILTHIKTSSKNKTLIHHKAISIFADLYDRLQHCSLQSLFYGRVTSGFPLDYPLEYTNLSWMRTLFLVGSCNGLICTLTSRHQFFLWNPCTKKSKKLPDVGDDLRQHSVIKYGFGFDEINDDYKVYAVLSLSFVLPKQRPLGILYSLKSDSWKRITEVDVGSTFETAAKFVSGNLHWCSHLSLRSGWHIVSYDLKNEVYGIIEKPSTLVDSEGFYLGIMVIDGCLGVLCEYPEDRLDVWIWKQYGVKDSWSKMMSIPYINYPDKLLYLNSSPLCMSAEGEFLFYHRSRFLVYNPKDDSIRRSRTIRLERSSAAMIYVESLVSPIRDDDDGEQERENQIV